MSAADCVIVRALVAQHGTAAEVAAFDRIVKDVARFRWCLPVVSGDADGTADVRTRALFAALAGGYQGVEAIDAAMRGAR